jgi:HK97 family phage major capsid protein
VVTGGTATSATSGSAAVTAAEVQALLYNVHEEYAANGAFLMKTATEGSIRALQATSSAGAFLFQETPQGGIWTKTLLQKPLFHSGSMDGIGSAKYPIVFGDFSMYAIVQREGMVVSRNPYLYQANGQIGLFAKVRQGGAVLQAEAFSVMLTAT